MKNVQKTALRRDGIDPDPLRQFSNWLQDAEQTELQQPNAMTLTTASLQGKPSARIVLLRGIDNRGFVFFTNYESRKAQDIQQNPAVALLFHWPPLSRQVRIEGTVVALEASESDLYFANRPRGHQLEAHASAQSQVISDRAALECQFEKMSQQFEGKNIPRPQNWGGYRTVPETLEFWQEGEHRLHDRLRYRRNAVGTWVIERLAP